MEQEIHKGDIGTLFKLTLYDRSTIVNLQAATAKTIVFKNPKGITTSKTATFATDGTDGIIQYRTVSGDLSVAGKWQIQAVVTFPDGKWSSSIVEFVVHPNLVK